MRAFLLQLRAASLPFFLLAMATHSPLAAQHTMVMHTPESAQEEANSSCRNSMWERDIPQLPPERIGNFQHPITGNAAAQAYFNQGLIFYYGFDTLSAMQSFHQATVSDPGAAMGYWGVALAAGGDLNIPIDDPCMVLAIEQARMAIDRLDRVTAPEKLYIDAIRVRYGLDTETHPAGRDPAQLSVPYMLAMRDAWQRLFVSPPLAHRDPEVAALHAVSLMNLRPWLWWTTSGEQSEEIAQALEALRSGLVSFPRHFGLNHFYIHAMEEAPIAQATAADVVQAADFLQANAPEITPHLRHMPSHIYLLRGDWKKVIAANERAVAADQPWRDQCNAQGEGPKCNPMLVGHYRSHDLLFLTVGLANQGNWPPVEHFAGAAEDNAKEFIAQEEGLEHYLTTRVMMGTHFAQWEYVRKLAPPQETMPQPDPAHPELYCPKLKLPLASALYYFGQTMAASAMGDRSAADRSLYLYNLSVPPAAWAGAITTRRQSFPWCTGACSHASPRTGSSRSSPSSSRAWQ